MADLSVIEFKIHIVKRILITWCVYFVVVFPLFSEQKVLEWLENNVVLTQSVDAETGLDGLDRHEIIFSGGSDDWDR
jgi:hypothetical protein